MTGRPPAGCWSWAQTPNITDNSDGGDFNIKGKQRLKLLGKKHARGKNVRLTPLHAAALLDSPVVASVLIAGGADIRAKTNSGLTPLHFAAQLIRPDAAAALIEGGAVVNAEDKRGETPLDYAMERGRTEVEAFLREIKGALGAARTKTDIGVLAHCGSSSGRTTRMAFDAPLETARMSMRRTRAAGTPLYEVANNAAEVAKVLIANDADVNTKDNFGNTPLHWAAIRNATEVAKLLIDNGTDVNVKGGGDWTPLDFAIDREKEEMQYLLRQHGGRCNESC